MWDWIWIGIFFGVLFFVLGVMDFTMWVVEFIIKKFEQRGETFKIVQKDHEYAHDWEQYWDEVRRNK